MPDRTREEPLTAADLRVGATYRAKRPRQNLLGEYNDRTVLFIGRSTLQYDGIAVKQGQRYPSIPIERFLKWASHEVLQ